MNTIQNNRRSAPDYNINTAEGGKIQYRYETIKQLPQYIYNDIVEMFSGGWLDGKTGLNRVIGAKADVKPSVIIEIFRRHRHEITPYICTVEE